MSLRDKIYSTTSRGRGRCGGGAEDCSRKGLAAALTIVTTGGVDVVTEYSDAKSKSNETNPLRLSNLFYLTVGSINLLAGGVIAFLLTRETQSLELAAVPSLAVAATLMVLGIKQVSQAWRDEKFRFHSDDVGGLAVSAKFKKDGKEDQSGHVIDVLNNGVQPAATPDNALLRKLYNLLPRLELAPDIIRFHAETQALRIAKLIVATLGFGLAWLFAKPEVFAWMAPIYLLLAVNPMSVARSLSSGAAGDQHVVRSKLPTASGAVFILLMSVFGPIMLGLLPPGTLPVAPYAASMIVVPTITAMAVLLLASTLFILALRSQTRDLTQSGVSHHVRKNLNVPNLSTGLIDRLESELPFPRKVLYRNSGWQSDGNFGGSLLAESEPTLNDMTSHGSTLQALSAAWLNKEQRALVALGAVGALAGILATVVIFVYTRNSNITLFLTALALFSASQFALVTARGMWNRVDFTSTVYHIHYKGSYRQAQRVAGSLLGGNGTLTESATRIEHVDFRVCVARTESVAFARKGVRYIQSIDLKPEQCEEQFKRIEDFYNDVMQRKAQSYSEEGLVRRLVQGGDAAAANGQPVPMLTSVQESEDAPSIPSV